MNDDFNRYLLLILGIAFLSEHIEHMDNMKKIRETEPNCFSNISGEYEKINRMRFYSKDF